MKKYFQKTSCIDKNGSYQGCIFYFDLSKPKYQYYRELILSIQKKKLAFICQGLKSLDEKKRFCHMKTLKAIKQKILLREKCGIRGCQEIADAHHWSYNHPLSVEWLCRSHHITLHASLKKRKLTLDKKLHKG
jgi:hypothetical protein